MVRPVRAASLVAHPVCLARESPDPSEEIDDIILSTHTRVASYVWNEPARVLYQVWPGGHT